MEKLTFIQYLESKAKLLEAVKKSPKHSVTYSVSKYCKMIVGESKDEKVYIPLKPKNHVTVEYLYEDIDNPSIIGVSVNDVDEVDPNKQYNVFWEKDRFTRWLDKNTKEQK